MGDAAAALPGDVAAAEVYDHEVEAIARVYKTLQDRCGSMRNYPAFEREIHDRFAEIGFTVGVTWHRYSVGGVEQEGLLPDVTVTGRTDPGFRWDPDRQVHEVTQNILDLPGQEKGEVIKTDRGGAFRAFREGDGTGHSHGHSHPHAH